VAVIEHPPGDETQWDWAELPDPPVRRGWGSKACLLAGALAHSGWWRGWLSASMDQPHLIAGLDRVTRPGRTHRGVAVRPDGHRRAPRIGAGDRVVRGGSQALRGVRAAVPAAARQPQGRSGEGQPCRGAAVLAHPGRRRHARAAQQLFDPGAPGAGTCGCARPPTAGPPSPFSPPASRCTPGRPLAGHDHSSLGNPRAGAGRQG